MTLEERIQIFFDLAFGVVYDCLEFISPTPVRDKVDEDEELNVVFFLKKKCCPNCNDLLDKLEDECVFGTLIAAIEMWQETVLVEDGDCMVWGAGY